MEYFIDFDLEINTEDKQAHVSHDVRFLDYFLKNDFNVIRDIQLLSFSDATFELFPYLRRIELFSCSTAPSYLCNSCPSLSEIYLPNCSQTMDYAFANCPSLKSVSISQCYRIGSSTFYNCTTLSTITLPRCTRISAYAFAECTSLSTLYLLAESVCTLGAVQAFANTPMSDSTYLGYYGSIYVPQRLVNDYKMATNWAQYSNRIVGV